MSTAKSPQEKKALSLAKDRRNLYGESPHSSRKNIKRGKQNQHQEERRTANQALALINAGSSEEQMIAHEVAAETRARLHRLDGFKKEADRPLGDFIERQQERRERSGMLDGQPKRDG
ncbi:hypothetical protein [Janthinobacterium psychrotolerans]|uniref:Uncharacterized protein n=1 Tax=Janthinobacterium psychrotolerans TaxID=1747903 RepID=A0A1A7BYW2_9BURK|nr:hypothetical protein [Janthinobacterium psychrotolerans]OBV37924.1 hypothetical protein ASR47_1004199 [Janthinobacterium psychrotolerans]